MEHRFDIRGLGWLVFFTIIILGRIVGDWLTSLII